MTKTVTKTVTKIRIKFCGLTRPSDIDAAARAGAAYVGFVFFADSPRNISLANAAGLAARVPVGMAKVGLMVNPTDADLRAVTDTVPLDMIQLHGGEPPARVAEVKILTGLPVMKAVGISDAADVVTAHGYETVADQLLLDAKAPKGAALPGGNGHSFDWSLIAGETWNLPWMLAGGLTPDNVADAVRQSGARQVDVSSGIEDAPGEKSAQKMAEFEQSLQYTTLYPSHSETRM